MNIGYGRVTGKSLNAEMQISALMLAGCTRVFIDPLTEKYSDTEFKNCFGALRPGDTLMVWTLDRLDKSVRDLMELLDMLQARGIYFHAITERIDTSTIMGMEMLRMIGIFADLQRSQITERSRVGREVALAKGVKMGRKPLLSSKQIQAAQK